MSERVVRKSPSVATREIDLSGPREVLPEGVPAAVVGTANQGPAFVPVTVASFAEFENVFGKTDGEKFGPLALNEWFKNAKAGTYVRVLGTGDGKKKDSSNGTVTSAGFVVGDKLPQSNGSVGSNTNVGGDYSARAYFLGCFMSGSAGSGYLDDAGITGVEFTAGTGASNPAGLGIGYGAQPLLRGVMFAPNGVALTLSGSHLPMGIGNTQLTASTVAVAITSGNNAAGSCFGAVDFGGSSRTEPTKQDFTMFLNGHKNSPSNPSVITASFNPGDTSYFPNVLNTDPLKIEEAGHYLYTHYDVYTKLAIVTGSAILSASSDSISPSTKEMTSFLLTSSIARNTFDSNGSVPNFESFKTRYKTAKSPFVISQEFGGSNKNLFRVHALDDGAAANTTCKISVQNLQKSKDNNNKYGKFDLVVRDFYDNDYTVVPLESFRGLTLDPNSDRYIARVVGDQRTFFDFDKNEGSQKLVVEGAHTNKSRYIRVEMSDAVRDEEVDATALPVGFRGPQHLVTSGSGILAWTDHTHSGSSNNSLWTHMSATDGANDTGKPSVFQHVVSGAGGTDLVERVVQPPVNMRKSVAVGTGATKRANSSLHWGVQFDIYNDPDEPNKNVSKPVDKTLVSLTKYFPDFHPTGRNVVVDNNAGKADSNGTILDVDRFNNNKFSLEQVQVKTGSADLPKPDEWHLAEYRRAGALSSALTNSRFLDIDKDFGDAATRKYLKFSFYLYGGFDGANVFNEDKAKFTNNAVKREMDDSSNQGGVDGPTVQAYRRAVDVLEEKAFADLQLLAIPGLRHESVSDYAVDAMEDRFDALYIMDIEERDTIDTVVTASLDADGNPVKINVRNTVTAFRNRSLDSSFGAAYFPDVVLTDPNTRTNVQCPPSVAVLGAFSLNDTVRHPWYAPAGFSRGALKGVLRSRVNLNHSNLDDLYDADINPITKFPGTPNTLVFGQKTLLAAASALDRVNVRRLLIEVRRRVRTVANTLLFEPNRESTLAKFSAAVNPILATIQKQQGLDRYKVVIDTTTTTQADVENNTLRGKIFLQPTRSVEFISLDFVVTNPGAGGVEV